MPHVHVQLDAHEECETGFRFLTPTHASSYASIINDAREGKCL